MRAVIDALSAHIAVLDQLGNIRLVNAAWRDFAVTNNWLDPQVGLCQNYISLCENATGLFSDEAARIAKGIRDVLSGRRDIYTLQYPCHSPVEHRWFLVRITRFALQGQAWAVVAHENITELWQKSEALRRLNQELRDITYSMSHDLRSPLRGIDHLAQWVLEDASNALPAESKADLVTLRQRIEHMNHMLDAILDYVRTGQSQAPIEVVDTSQLIRELFALMTTASTFRLDAVPPLPTVRAARAPMALVLHHLIHNAVEHHHSVSGRVRISATYLPPHLEFCVDDDGPGIPASAQYDIFLPLRTLEPLNSRKTSGMGLALVKKMLDHYGGDVRVESQEGQGARFYVRWPVEPYEMGNQSSSRAESNRTM